MVGHLLARPSLWRRCVHRGAHSITAACGPRFLHHRSLATSIQIRAPSSSFGLSDFHSQRVNGDLQVARAVVADESQSVTKRRSAKQPAVTATTAESLVDNLQLPPTVDVLLTGLPVLLPNEFLVVGVDPDSRGAFAVLHLTRQLRQGEDESAHEPTGSIGCSGDSDLEGSPVWGAGWQLHAAVHDIPGEQVTVGAKVRNQVSALATARLLQQLLPTLAAGVRSGASAAGSSSSAQGSPSPLAGNPLWVYPAGMLAMAVVERPAPTALTGKQSWFKSGYGFGVMTSTLCCAEVDVHVVWPRVWKSDLGLQGLGKEGSRQLALAAYPQLATSLRRKMDHGRAEALLLAAWALGLRRGPSGWFLTQESTLAKSLIGGGSH